MSCVDFSVFEVLNIDTMMRINGSLYFISLFFVLSTNYATSRCAAVGRSLRSDDPILFSSCGDSL